MNNTVNDFQLDASTFAFDDEGPSLFQNCGALSRQLDVPSNQCFPTFVGVEENSRRSLFYDIQKSLPITSSSNTVNSRKRPFSMNLTAPYASLLPPFFYTNKSSVLTLDCSTLLIERNDKLQSKYLLEWLNTFPCLRSHSEIETSNLLLNDFSLWKMLCEIDEEHYSSLGNYINMENCGKNTNALSVTFLYRAIQFLVLFFQMKYNMSVDLVEIIKNPILILDDNQSQTNLKEQFFLFLKHLLCTLFTSQKLVERLLILELSSQNILASIVKEIMDRQSNRSVHVFHSEEDLHFLFEMTIHFLNMGSSLQQKIYLDKQVIEEQRNDSRKLYLENGSFKTRNLELSTQIDDMVINFTTERCQLFEQINKLEIELSELGTHKKKIEKQELLVAEYVDLKEKLLILENITESLRDENIHLQQTIHSYCTSNNFQNMDGNLNEISNRVNECLAEREILLEEIQHLNLEIGFRNRKIDSLLFENSNLKLDKQVEKNSLETSMNLYEDLKDCVLLQAKPSPSQEIHKVKTSSFSIQTQTSNPVSNEKSCETERLETISTSVQTETSECKVNSEPKTSLTPSKMNNLKPTSPKQPSKILKLGLSTVNKPRSKKEAPNSTTISEEQQNSYRFYLRGHDFQ